MSTPLFQELLKKYPPLISQRQLKEITGEADSTIEQRRLKGTGIPFIRLGRSVRYRLDDVVAYLDGLPRYTTTSAMDHAA
jgi:hypothetical protein